MKKSIVILLIGVMLSFSASAQSAFTFNTRAWSTNYWTTLIYEVARTTLQVTISMNEGDDVTFARLVPGADLVFPVGIEKAGFEANDIYGPYHRAFSNPFTKIGDFGLGLDMSYKPAFLGIYAGAFFKSQEIWFKNGDNNLRGFYFQPRAGLIMGRGTDVEAGVYYDLPVGAAGSFAGVDKEMIMGGFGLDFALSHSFVEKQKTMLTFMLPLHNFLNEDYASGVLNGMKRRVGYIMLTQRISF